ncbi:Chromosome partitioning protein ParA [Methylophaga frappieri]|uniref:Chromosome partitioning protein ParA n=1 Tax=Methylophaga frappieri (strain ATCC BAA-2434 / DSM 25690 / JAM7) TaxID=754477 RepID=I1YE69_METFJ|nr:AAA family ATPase [Methylophaga frappieri]AFJ01212.1 Chromosome partitioning protein ParA [Methylophaga frappieri]
MNKLAFFNLKGGVGKTTSAVNIAWHAAQDGIPTLLWDLDPQGAASWLLHRKAKSKSEPKKVLAGKTAIGELVKATDYPNLDIIPADFSFREFDVLLSDITDKQNAVDKLLAPFSERYALIILDCPPSFSTLSEQIFDTADVLYMPLIPTHLSLRTFEQTRDFFKQHKLKPKRLRPFFNMVDRRRSLHRVMISHPPKMLKNGLQSTIPYAAVVERMGDFQAPLGSFAENTPVAQAYANLWQEIKADFP